MSKTCHVFALSLPPPFAKEKWSGAHAVRSVVRLSALNDIDLEFDTLCCCSPMEIPHFCSLLFCVRLQFMLVQKIYRLIDMTSDSQFLKTATRRMLHAKSVVANNLRMAFCYANRCRMEKWLKIKFKHLKTPGS